MYRAKNTPYAILKTAHFFAAEDREDNCPFVYNPHQRDTDKNRIGDACDAVAYSNTSTQNHSDTEGGSWSTHNMENSGTNHL